MSLGYAYMISGIYKQKLVILILEVQRSHKNMILKINIMSISVCCKVSVIPPFHNTN